MPTQDASKANGSPQQQDTPVQAENLLSQPEADEGQVAEEVSLDQQSARAREVGHVPPEAAEALADSLKKPSAQ